MSVEVGFKEYPDLEFLKCQCYKQIWKSATNPAIKSKFIEKCRKGLGAPL